MKVAITYNHSAMSMLKNSALNRLFQHAGAKGGLHHNVYFLFVGHVLQSDCDMTYSTEGKSYVVNSFFDDEKIDMGLLKCNVHMDERSIFKKGNQEYTDVEQWPEEVQIIWY